MYCYHGYKLKECRLSGFEAGNSVKLTEFKGRKVKLPGAEDALARLAKQFQDLRTTGAPLNITTARDRLNSPHLLSSDSPPIAALLMMSSRWLYRFLRTECGSFREVWHQSCTSTARQR